MVRIYKMFIGGTWVNSHSGQTYDIVESATTTVIAKIQKGDEVDARFAIDSARRAFDSGVWSGSTPAEREELLLKLAELVEKNADNLAKIEAVNVGKTYKYARYSDFPFIIDNLKFFAGAARQLQGEAVAEYTDVHASKGRHSALGTSLIRREPIGVVAGIVPWNYPLYIATWKLAPALAAGDTIVLKPASLTPLSLLEFAKLVEKAGFPKGVFNVITGPGEIIGRELATSPKVDMISLTGDTETGKKIMQYVSSSIKKVHLELGGKAPLIVLDDANLEAAAEGTVVGAFWNSGQDCTAVTRVLVPEKLHDKFVRMIAERAKNFRIGYPLQTHIDMGPLVSFKQRERVESYVKLALSEGAKLVCGGKRPIGAKFSRGAFYEPTILINVKHSSRVCQDEIFGPVLTVHKYRTINESIRLANDVKYGLAASVWGSNVTKCMEIARELDFGTVWINEHGVLVSEMPHGGFKQSGFGKDLSIHSLEEYTRIKHVYIDATGKARKPWHYVVYGDK